MLDRKFIVENAEAVAKNCELRGVTADVARLVELEGQRRELLQQTEELNRRANEVSKSIGQASSDEEREQRKAEGRSLREQKESAQKQHGAGLHSQPPSSATMKYIAREMAKEPNGNWMSMSPHD